MERVVSGPQPPAWLVHELQHRTVLFLNHVLMQEREAMERLARQSGRSAHVQWRNYFMTLLLTPAGLLELAPEGTMPDLRLEVSDSSPLQLARSALAGERPAIRIEGDVQLAADINWVVDHLRGDVEEDLSRLVGDARRRVGDKVALQGNMDPTVLYAKPEAIRAEVGRILASYGKGTGHVFNLGHGITPEVNPEHAGAFLQAVHELSAQYHV